jgi:hypothetical protein
VTEPAIALEQLGNPEVEQLDLAADADEHVGRLDVAVHDQVGVCVGDGLEHVEKQLRRASRPSACSWQ